MILPIPRNKLDTNQSMGNWERKWGRSLEEKTKRISLKRENFNSLNKVPNKPTKASLSPK